MRLCDSVILVMIDEASFVVYIIKIIRLANDHDLSDGVREAITKALFFYPFTTLA